MNDRNNIITIEHLEGQLIIRDDMIAYFLRSNEDAVLHVHLVDGREIEVGVFDIDDVRKLSERWFKGNKDE